MGQRGGAARVLALAGVMLLISQAAPAGQDWTAEGWRSPAPARAADQPRPAATPLTFAFAPSASFAPAASGNLPRPAYLPAIAPPFSPPSSAEQVLSPAVMRVSQLASRNGDLDYLMVDKSHGRLIQFANGVPVFVTRALTGTSLADQLPPESLSKSYRQQLDARYRVTPAGRFTVSHGFDQVVGATLDINEIKGKDWTIAIHSTGSARRAALLWSELDQDKHITEGCINVAPETMRHLAALWARRARIPLYILPMDESLITKIF
jgi:hypothetical protein